MQVLLVVLDDVLAVVVALEAALGLGDGSLLLGDLEHPFEDVVLALDSFKESPLVAAPGAKYSYTTHGYILLSAVVQRAGAASYWSQVRTRVCEPAGLTSLRPDYQWLTVSDQILLPLSQTDVHPIPYSTIYTAD